MQLRELDVRLAATGARPAHAQAILRAWMRGLPLERATRRPEDLPRVVRQALPAIERDLAALATPTASHASFDGAMRLLLRLADGESVESVLLPRQGVCVSTQVGCAVGCTFCMTGRDGLRRQLGSAEIVAQVALARRMRTVRKVVFMGMGEPAHNLDAVMDAIEILGTQGDVPHKNLVLSTIGDPRVFARLPAARVKPALALSLHSTFPDRRAQLLPRAPRLTPAALIEAAERYARATHYPTQYQWTLLEGVNDGDDEIDNLARLLADKYAVLNLIAWNRVDGLPFRRPARERMHTITRELGARGILVKLRDSSGQDVDAGCGQLRSRPQPA